MRKVFFSFLGTSNYLPCNYIFNRQKSGSEDVFKNVRFVQEATVAHHCQEWKKQDAVYIFTTVESHEKNWLDNGHKDTEGKVIQCEGLLTAISKLALPPEVCEVPIRIGKNEDEIWDIFSTVINKIQPEDELYLDITHAFRSLPLLAMVIINYAKITKNISVKAIDYGAMEAIGESWKVKELPIEERDVPVFHLLPFDKLLDWTTAIDNFLTAGTPKGIIRLTEKNITPVLKDTKGKNDDASSLRSMAKHLGNFSATMATCRGKEVSGNALALQTALKKVQDQQLIKPLAPLLEKLSERTKAFSGNEVRDGVAAAKWCYEHNLIQQGFTLLQETICSHVLISATDADHYDETNRNLVNKALHIRSTGKRFEQWDKDSQNNQKLVKTLCAWLNSNEKISKLLEALRNDRNDINHAGIRDNPMAAKNFFSKLDKHIADFTIYSFTE